MDTRAIPTTPKRSLPDACCMCNAVLFVLCHRAPLSSIIMPVFRKENLAEVADLDQYDDVDLEEGMSCTIQPRYNHNEADVVALWRSAHFTWMQPPTRGVKLRMWCCKKLTLDGDKGKSTTHTGSTFVT